VDDETWAILTIIAGDSVPQECPENEWSLFSGHKLQQ
jgi:hypothetical protein